MTTAAKQARTPGPWTLVPHPHASAGESVYSIQSADLNGDGDYVAEIWNATDAHYIFAACNAHDELVAALTDADQRFAALANLIASYPRPSNDPNGRTLLDAKEMAKASAIAARTALAKAGQS